MTTYADLFLDVAQRLVIEALYHDGATLNPMTMGSPGGGHMVTGPDVLTLDADVTIDHGTVAAWIADHWSPGLYVASSLDVNGSVRLTMMTHTYAMIGD